jgi:hypothetical protein
MAASVWQAGPMVQIILARRREVSLSGMDEEVRESTPVSLSFNSHLEQWQINLWTDLPLTI